MERAKLNKNLTLAIIGLLLSSSLVIYGVYMVCFALLSLVNAGASGQLSEDFRENLIRFGSGALSAGCGFKGFMICWGSLKESGDMQE